MSKTTSKTNIKEFERDEIQIMLYNSAKDGAYKNEESDDRYLNTIKNVCLSYIDNIDKPNVLNKITLEDVNKALIFIDNKTSEIYNLKKKLEIKDYNWQLTEIKQTMDEFLLSGSLGNTCNEIIGAKLTKDISNIMDTFKLCYVTLKKIRNELIKNEHRN